MAGHLLGGPGSAAQASPNDIYLEAATGNLIIRLANGTVLTLTPAGALTVAGGIVAGGTDLLAALAALQAAIAAVSTTQLTNGGFEVMQRTPPFSANLAYCHDRWQLLLGGTSTATVTDETALVDAGSGHALKAVYVQGSANSSIDQKLEQFAQLRGGQLTLRLRVRAGAVGSVRPYVEDSGVRTYGAANVGTGAYETLTVTAAIGAAASAVRVGLSLQASDTVYLDNATAAVGAVPLAFAPVHPGVELERCQRYYQVYGGASNAIAHYLYSAAVNTYFVLISFETRTAIVPTVTKNGTWGVTANTGQPVPVSPSPDGVLLGVQATAATAAMYGFGLDSADDTLVVEANP
jgi:hypothetical protein